MHRYVSLFSLLLALIACGSTPPSAQVQTVEVPVTVLVPVTTTPDGDATVAPTEPPTEPATATTEAADFEPTILYRDVASTELMGLQIELIHLAFDEREAMLAYRLAHVNRSTLESNRGTYWQNYAVLGEIYLRITNTSSRVVKFYPRQGKLALDSEQINFIDTYFGIASEFGDDVDGDILPGVSAEGGWLFGTTQTLGELATLSSVFLQASVNNEVDFGDLQIQATLSD